MMKLKPILLSVYTGLLLFAPEAYSGVISPAHAEIRYVGRFNTSNPAAPRMYWSGTHIIAWFEGTSCRVKLNCAGGNDFFNIIVDDGTPVKYDLAAGAQTIVAASGLTDGVHKIEVFKRTSYQQDNTAFEGFIVDDGKGLAPLPPAPAIKIQFYGDSITDGHSVDALSDNSEATYWNNYLTYAAITARNLNMEYVSTSASGIAVIHPWGPGFIMDNYYDRIIPGDNSAGNAWDFSQYIPDIVVVNLFQNDAWVNSSPHTPAEQEAIITAYEDLLVKIRAAHPDAEIICALGNMDATRAGSVWPGYITSAVDRMNGARNDPKVYSLFFPYKGTGGHPVASEQVPMADALTEFIQSDLGYFFTADTDGDGLTDVQETALGTDPDDEHSAFSFTEAVVDPSTGKILLSWPGVTGMRYRLWKSTDLVEWEIVRDWAPTQALPEDWVELNLTPSNAFFRVEADI